MSILTHIKEDWRHRLPYRVRYNRYRGMSRTSYAILSFLYYVIKDLILLVSWACFRLLKLIFWDLWRGLYYHFHPDVIEEDESDDEEEYEEYDEEEYDEVIENLPFCQLFPIGDQMCLLVDHIEMCPDETAFIRVVDDEGYTPLYKRKVRRDKSGNRFIVFNGINHYLDDAKTQPVSIKK